MNKGSTDPVEWTTTAINLFLVIIIASFMLIVYLKFSNESYNAHYLDSRMFFESLVYDKNCLAYNDGFKTYIGVIDQLKISDLNLEKCYSRPNIGYKIILSDINGREISSASSKQLSNFLPICETQPNFKCSKKINYIFYFKDNKLNQGFLTTEVITNA